MWGFSALGVTFMGSLSMETSTSGLTKYQYHVEAYLGYLVLQLYREPRTMVLFVWASTVATACL